MSRINGFYKVRHHNQEKIMRWESTNTDNTATVSGFWIWKHDQRSNNHDLDFIDEKKLTDKEVLGIINP